MDIDRSTADRSGSEKQLALRSAVPTNLTETAINMCRKRMRSLKVADSTGAELTGGDLLLRSLVLRRMLRRSVLSPDEQHVGILLPPTAAAVAVNLALTLDNRTVINLNYTLTSAMINASIAQAGVRHVLTSRRFMERLEVQLDAELIYLEDFKDAASKRDKAIAAAMTYAVPTRVLSRFLGAGKLSDDDPIAIMFTSGTTGDPKGAVLTHGNLKFNITAIDAIIHLDHHDVLIGILPFFHSFGFSVTLWAPLALDVVAAYHVNPLEALTVGRLCRERGGTILLSTPMFLRTYIRRCAPADFASLEVVVTGAEKLPAHVADDFEQKFGIRPVEGYGTTETSPLISANIPPNRAFGDPAAWAREGTVGKPAPGVRVKIVDQETGVELPAGESGMLLVSGPNVMKEYYNRPDATTEAIRGGWYSTGDICTIDEAGFIHIIGRESRFAKIGGEIVPHGMIEDALNDIVGFDEEGGPKLIVLSVPDRHRGERLVVIHTHLDQSPAELRQRLQQSRLPNLFIPGAESFYEIDALPAIGTGKLDVRRLKRIAERVFAEQARPPKAEV